MADPTWTHVFAGESGSVPASQLDDNFNQATQVNTDTPLIPVAGGTAGTSGYASRVDHQHPPQSGTLNTQTGTTYTLVATDNGKIVEFTNGSAVALTLENSLAIGFNCLVCQAGAGQVTLTPEAGATLRQASSLTKTRTQWSQVSLRIRANTGVAAEYVASGDMA